MFDVWKNVLEEIKLKISMNSFATWFADSELLENNNGAVKVGAKSAFHAKMMTSKYAELVKEALKNNGVDVKSVKFVVNSSVKPVVKPREVTGEMAGSVARERVAKIKQEVASTGFRTGLNAKYTFENFVVGSNNDLAVSAAKSIVDAPGEKVNPFFLYGGPGLGKTHLVQAIGNELVRQNPETKVLYTPINHFYADFIDSVRTGKGKDFSRKFQKLDCLIIDDFQLIVGKEKSQEEFFNIFNDLYQLNKQIIVTSDRLPSQIKTVDERLASRLTWAGAFDLQLPKFEDKCAILKAKAEFMGAEIEPEAIEYIAENVNTNIRDLEGELSKFLMMAEIRGVTPLALIQNGALTVSSHGSGKMRSVTAKQVIDKTAKYYGISAKELASKSRVTNIKNARQVAMYLLSKELSMSTPKIAAEVGVKDHTTVMHGIKKIEERLKLDFKLKEDLDAIKNDL